MKTDEELKKTYTVGEVGSIIQLTIFQEEKNRQDNARRVQLIHDDVFSILNSNPEKDYTALVDTSALGKISYVSPEGRKMYAKIAECKQIKKIAVVGKLGYVGAVVNIVVKLSGSGGKLKYFDTSEDALHWLSLEEF